MNKLECKAKQEETEIKYKVCSIHDAKVIIQDGKTYLEGYANTKDHTDAYGDTPTSFNGEPVYDLTRMEKNPVAFVDHHQSASMIAGNFVELKEDDTGLWFRLLVMNLEDIYIDRVKHAVSAFVKGFGRALSIGGRWVFGDDDNPSHLTKAFVYEISLVGIGADRYALTDSPYPKSATPVPVKQIGSKAVTPWDDLPKSFAAVDRRWDAAEADSRWRVRSGSLDSQSEEYKKNFLCGGRLPVGDIVDGVHKAVPRAIFVARAIIAGARGGIELNASDLAGVKDIIGRYYEEMELYPPFGGTKKGIWSKREITNLPRAELDFVLRNETLSRSAAKYIASLVCSSQECTETLEGEEADGTKALGEIVAKLMELQKIKQTI